MIELKKSEVSRFKYNEFNTSLSWGKQFVSFFKLNESQDENVRGFATKLSREISKQKAIEMVRQVTVAD